MGEVKMLNKAEKIINKLDDMEYIEQITEKYLEHKREIGISLTKIGQPENYVRERYTGRGNRFYNSKENIMKNMRTEILGMLDITKLHELQTLINNKDAIYYVYITVNFFLGIPKVDSIETKILKEKKIILPCIRKDLDNYIKLIVDVLHDVAFDDDKRVVEINANKFYSMNPRTEMKIRIEIIKE